MGEEEGEGVRGDNITERRADSCSSQRENQTISGNNNDCKYIERKSNNSKCMEHSEGREYGKRQELVLL